MEYFSVLNLHMPIKLDWIDTGRHCSPTPCIFILLRGEITVFTSSAKANFSNPQALLPYILSFQLAVVKVLWKILIFKTCQASVLLWSTLSNCHFSISFLCVFLLFLCVYLCVFFLYIQYFYAVPVPVLIISSTFLFTYIGHFSVLLPLLLQYLPEA